MEKIKKIPGFREDQMTGYKPGRVYDPEWNRWVDDPVEQRTDIVPGSKETFTLEMSYLINKGLASRQGIQRYYNKVGKERMFSELDENGIKYVQKLFSDVGLE